MSSEERSGWRDESISLRHRLYGNNVPMQDLDCVELDYGVPVAFMEWKNEHAAKCSSLSPQIQTLVWIANKCERPAFGIRYASDFSWWRVTALNDLARKFIPEPATQMTEIEYVDFLYSLRGRTLEPVLRKFILENYLKS